MNCGYDKTLINVEDKGILMMRILKKIMRRR